MYHPLVVYYTGMMKTKTCTKCNTPKPIDEFSFKNKAKGTRHSQCQICAGTAKTLWYRRNRKAHIAANKVRNQRYRKENEQHLIHYLEEHPCVDCGEDNILVLDFDHKSDKVDGIAAMLANRCSWTTILKEINKCEVRCANCHRKRTAEQGNSYKFRYIMEHRPWEYQR